MSTKRQQAIQQANELARVERKIRKTLLKSMGKVKRLAMQYTEGFILRSKDLAPIQDALLTAQVTAHLLGQRSVKRAAKNKGLKLSVVDDVLNLLSTADEQQVQLLVSRYSPDVSKVMQNLTTRLTQSMRDALEEAIQSQVTPKAAIASFFTRAGLSEDNPFFVETLLRTQTQLAYGAARWEEYESPGIAEIIWGYTYITVGDDRVRENHAELDGVTLPKDDKFWNNFFPPNGYNCRCQVVPVFDKEPVKKPPKQAATDQGFDFNPAQLLRSGVAS